MDPTNGSTEPGESDVKTFRGRSLEEVLPRIREELGPDAIVLRRREGLGGGVGGFFQRPYVEVDARKPLGDERPLEIRSDRATVEGLSSPAVQALFEQATPFADALAAAAAREARPLDEDTFSATIPRHDPPPAEPPREFPPAEPWEAPAEPPRSAGLYGPQPNASAIEDAAPQPEPPAEPAAPPPPVPGDAADGAAAAPTSPQPSPPPATEATSSPPEDDDLVFEAPPADVEAPERPAAADAAEKRLVAAGLSPELAAEIVGEAVSHGLPFATPRTFKKAVRTVLARRIPVLAALGPGPRALAFVGAGGSGKSSAVAHLAAAYAGAGADVAVIVLGGDSGALADRLEPLGVTVIGADDASQAAKRLARRSPLLTLIDTPAAGPGHPAAEIKALAADLKALGPDEIHLALPATLSAAAAAEVALSLAQLAPTHVALTHADETARPGAPLELALAARKPLSYVCARADAEPADPLALAQQLLP